MNTRFAFIVICFTILACKQNTKHSHDKDFLWENLFDVEHQKKWKMKINGVPLGSNYLNTYSFNDNQLEFSYKEYKKWDDKFGHIFYDEQLSHYIVELEYNIDGIYVKDAPSWAKLNSGIMLHAQSPQSMTMNQWFPMSLEMQFLACKDTIFQPTGNLCTPGTIVSVDNKVREDHCINSSSGLYPMGRWIKARAEVYGDSIIKHIIQDTVVFTYTKPKLKYENLFPADSTEIIVPPLLGPVDWKRLDGQPLKEGYLALQAESQEIKFRNVRLLNLCGCTDVKAKNYKSYFVKSENSKCVY
jgi:Domain of Unknown Function (DUF1080)